MPRASQRPADQLSSQILITDIYLFFIRLVSPDLTNNKIIFTPEGVVSLFKCLISTSYLVLTVFVLSRPSKLLLNVATISNVHGGQSEKL